jgi:hypothetical protein
MRANIYFIVSLVAVTLFSSCDHVENPYPKQQSMELDTTLYPGNWSDYLANEWPVFNTNTNTNRNVLIEDFTGHKCVYCPAAGDLAHQLHSGNPDRIFIASIHSGPSGIGDFQSVSPPEYPVDFTNPQGLEIGTYFGTNDGGFSGNPRGTVNRVNSGNIFLSPTAWTNLTNSIVNNNDLKVNLQSALNYYPSTKGAFLHVEVEKIDQTITNDLAVVAYLIEDSLVGDQKMSDNTHNQTYVHRDIHRGNIDSKTFGRVLKASDLTNGKYYVNYSFEVPNQLDGNYNAANMHLLIYVYDRVTWEIYQVIKQPIMN